MNTLTSFRVFGWLLWSEIRLFTKDFVNNLIDAICWPICNILASGFVLPIMGMPANYGGFMAISTLVIMTGWLTYLSSSELVADLDGTRSILYELTLPLTYWMVYLKIALGIAIKAGLFAVVVFPISKIFLGNIFDLSNFSLMKFSILYLLANLFFGTFAVWMAVFCGTVRAHGRLFVRVLCVLLSFSCFQFSWVSTQQASAILGKILLASPWVYLFEGIRASALGQDGYINFWICVGMTLLFITFFTAHGILLFKKRLDCV